MYSMEVEVNACIIHTVHLHIHSEDTTRALAANHGTCHAATDGDGGETKGDEEQGGDGGKQSKKKSGSDKDSGRGMLKGPGNRQQMRSRAHTPSDEYQQYPPQLYLPQQPAFVEDPPLDGYQANPVHGGELTRFPSINMDWQTLRAR